ncbi:outer membrane beta-barrel protein [Altererythrobacter arenosus]|uniref:Outer membrane beta-barrel protein n=1 Tax=Altererythrobacter arenosus TaxID=3032592 RepID=A0ABY8FRW8_9SPHN|nr:outer membrane beta-barrel protein [Altererythrobacter sp. CAU 1644]WFL76960.1 outer membrane beta-barrel protein [Altererythrobacter sp. CAU 1644]
MKKFSLLVAVAAGAVALPTAASAQEAAAETYVGISAGIHDLGVDEDDLGVELEDSSPIIGVVAGVDFPLGQSTFAGVEGNYHFGTDAIDSEYGASVRVGFQANGGAKYYVRGGYQWVDLDVEEIAGIDLGPLADDIDDTDGDYLVGVGADFPIGNSAFRVNLDTISFDTIRGTVGYVLKF